MQEWSSYSAHGAHEMAGGVPRVTSSGALVMPAPRPRRIHFSTIVLLSGMVICAGALLLTLAGVPAAIGYDEDAPVRRIDPSSNSPHAINASLDANMKWIAVNSGSGKEQYLGLIKSVNRNEAAIAAMFASVSSMNNSVKAIDSGLADVEQTATEMNAQMQSMVTTSGESVETMQDLEAQLGAISQSMVALAAATEQLTAQMNSIQQSASSIAANGTKDALAETQKINRALPATVPPPQLEGAPQ